MMTLVVPCLGKLASSCRDESCWKSLNKTVLLKTRSDSSDVRYIAIKVISELYTNLGEEMLIFFPETIPFFAELMEGHFKLILDDDPEIAQLCQDVCLQIQNYLGEPIQQYFNA
jgi:hypothetical protein